MAKEKTNEEKEEWLDNWWSKLSFDEKLRLNAYWGSGI